MGNAKEKQTLRPIDVHCHFFNRKEVSALMLISIIRMVKNAEIILSGKNSSESNNRQARQLSRNARSSLAFLMTSMQSPKRIFKKLSSYEKGFIFAPLMLDIHWLTQSPKNKEPYVRQTDVFSTIHAELDNISSAFQHIGGRRDATLEQRRISVEFRRIASSLHRLVSKKTFRDLPFINSSIDNFPQQEQQLTELALSHPNDILPFYAVDPRRSSHFSIKDDGSYDIEPLTRKLRINGGAFVGFKLYTPCGYSPTHPMLMTLYDYCEKHNVPIIAHVSGSGVTTLANELHIEGHVYLDGRLQQVNEVWHFDNKNLFARDRILEHSERLNHPMLWEYVLNHFPHLKINLAHFGHLPHSLEWTNYIWRMMCRRNADGAFLYPNLYTDFANIVSLSTLSEFHDRYFVTEPLLQNRFLYGSDYYMNLVYLNDMNDYVDNFHRIFSPEEFNLISVINPRRFLSLPLPDDKES